MGHDPSAKLDSVAISADFVIFKLETKWVNDPRQQNAAWALAVELLTRVATQDIDLNNGTLRDALNSLHALFGITREILRSGGPVVGVNDGTVGGTALIVLNKAVRPFLAEWHPKLLEWEEVRPPAKGILQHERDWSEGVRCRAKLKSLQTGLWQYAKALVKVAGTVPPT